MVTVVPVGEEMEHGPVVPETVPPGRMPQEQVRAEPGQRSGLPEPGPPDSEGSVGDVQNAHVDEPRAD